MERRDKFVKNMVAPVGKVLKELGAHQLSPSHEEGLGLVAGYLDPEGNRFAIVKLNNTGNSAAFSVWIPTSPRP